MNHISIHEADVKKDAKELVKRDLSLMVCYDHRLKNDFGEIINLLLEDVKGEYRNCFITRHA